MPDCSVKLDWFDTNLQRVASGVAGVNCERVDRLVGAGEQLFLRVQGTSDDVDFRLTNLVSVDGSTVRVTGTEGDDTFSFAAGATHQLVVNGIAYQFAAGAVNTIQIDGAGGVDTITLTGTAGNETATLRADSTSFSGAGFNALATNFENVVVRGGGGIDVAVLYDSTGDDRLTAAPDRVTLELSSGHVFQRMDSPRRQRTPVREWTRPNSQTRLALMW